MTEDLRELRAKLGVTTTQLAAAMQTSEGLIRKWETGTVMPRARRLVQLASCLGVGVDEVIDALYLSRDRRADR